jgi:hypothetical protein
MSTKRLAVGCSSLCVAAALCLSGCASSDMKSKDDSMQKPMMKDSGKTMNNDVDKHDDMNGSK